MTGFAPRHWLAGWLPALRVARREARRAKGRSALVIALIALPITGLSFAAASYDSARLTPEQELTRRMGAADAELHWVLDAPILQDPAAMTWRSEVDFADPGPSDPDRLQSVLPAGARAIPEREDELRLRTATGIGNLWASAIDLADPIYTGRVVIHAGRGPADTTELALTRRASTRLGAGVGDTVESADGTRRWRVVGIVEFQDSYREEVILHPDALSGEPSRWLVDTVEPIDWAQVKQLNQVGLLVLSRAVVLDPPPPSDVDIEIVDFAGGGSREVFQIGLVVAGLGLLEVVLLAGPAFAVGARRRQRDLALVAVAGATPAQLRRVVLADGVVLGLAAAAVGLVCGLAAATAARPVVAEYVLERPLGGLRFWPTVQLGLVGLAVLTGVLAALVPAVLAARQSVVAALAGRRGVTRVRRRWPILGAMVALAGAGLAGLGAWRIDARMVVGGLVLGQLGLVLATPALLGLIARSGRFLPLSLRISLRDTARNRAAAAPAVSAVMAAVAGALTVGVYAASDFARSGQDYLPSLPEGYVSVGYEVYDYERDAPTWLDPEQQRAVVEALSGLPDTESVVTVPMVACPPDSGEQFCAGHVPRPDENRCPAWEIEMVRELTADERRAARADARCQFRGFSVGALYRMVVDDGSLLATLSGADPADLAEATATLAAGGVVVGDPMLVLDGRATVEFYIGETPDPITVTVPAYVLESGQLAPQVTVAAPALVRQVGLTAADGAAVAVTDRTPTRAEQDELEAALQAIHPDLFSYVERGDAVYREFPVLLLAAAAGVIMLGAAGIATGLASADRHADLATLGAVGASPRVRRLLSLSQSGVIAGLGAVLGTLGGLGGACAVLFALNQRINESWPPQASYPITVPWQLLLTVLVIVPVVAMLGAGLFSRSRLPVERRLT